MKFSILYLLGILLFTNCAAQEFSVVIDGKKLIGEIDDNDTNRINFYFDRLTQSSVIKCI